MKPYQSVDFTLNSKSLFVRWFVSTDLQKRPNPLAPKLHIPLAPNTLTPHA